MNDDELTQFSRLMSSSEDIFDDERLDMYYSSKLVEWQKRQQTTVIHKFDGKTRLYL